MNIYIYGNDGFKKDIHKILNKANIKYKIDDDSIIKDINSLKILKETIKESPNDIYLIDDSKIIKKDGISKKIKFLIPKDGIEEEYLLENGIADLSVDNLSDIPKYILVKYEQEKAQSENIQESIVDIVEDAYNNEEIELDDELSALLSHEEDNEEVEENIQEEKDVGVDLDRIDEVVGFEEDVGLNNIAYDYDNEDIENNNDEEDTQDLLSSDNDEVENEFDDILSKEDDKTAIQNDTVEQEVEEFAVDKETVNTNELEEKGQDMNDEFSEFDSLNEEDILSALSDVENIGDTNISNESKVQEVVKTNDEQNEKNDKNEQVQLNSSNVNEISELISKLLNNKTLEITVKIKD